MNENEKMRGWVGVLGTSLPVRANPKRTFYRRDSAWTDGEFAEDDEFGWDYQEEHGTYFNVQPHRYASRNPGDGRGRYPTHHVLNWETDSWDYWRRTTRTWDWSSGRQVPRKVQNEMAGYRDPAVVEVT